ncbi:hemagglutinin repeat-containing protein [Termitidicoccus mucosus]|uniref:Filamentous haemagglutinin FhaB/tRNA nuclease CdiA-like TPS domain-containing protein n=1 Tax=Termitidicoccus mucosus TaxID=1184151 RepID=A0A178IHM7_9BACT|nr:hypothetical protein AW736_13045 [Opitutaceae bacterium TSB47]
MSITRPPAMKTRHRPSFLLRPRRWLNLLVASVFFAEMSLPSVCVAGGIVADPGAGANRPSIDGSANGVPVINIVRPNDRGVSHNKYQDFNVPGQGAILNNSGRETNTQLAGWIDKNVHFNPNDSARLILNEVTGPDISRLNGYLEVAGNRADVIIANPNGIYGANFGFINTSRALLATGRPEFDETGNLRSFAVRGGKVVIDGSGEGDHPHLGAYADLADQFDILARAVEINAQVFAKKLNIVTGANRVKYDTLDAEKIAADPAEAAPLVALDVAALGGMYAGRIRLVGTEDGLGVNTRGDLAAGIGGFTLTSEGRVVLQGQTTSDAALDIRAREGVANSGNLHAAENTALITRGAIENTGLLASQKDVVLTADGSIKNSGIVAAGLDTNGNFTNANAGITATAGADFDATDGRHYAGRNITLTASSLDLSRATTQASSLSITARSGDVIHNGARLGADVLTVSTPGKFDNSAGHINAAGIAIVAGSFANDNQGIIAQTGGGTLNLTVAGAFTNISGTINSFGNVAIAAHSLDNTTGYIAAFNNATFITRNGFTNTGGQLLSEGDLAITNLAGAFANRSGVIQSVGSLTLKNQPDTLDNTDGNILASGSLTLLAHALDNTRGNLVSDSAIALTLTDGLANIHGVIAGASDIAVTAASLDNTHGAIDANGKLAALLTGTLDNADGIITAAGGLDIRAAGITNTGEISSSAGAANVTATAGNIANTGIIYASGPLSLSAESGAVGNTGTDAALSTNSSLTLTARGLDNANAQVSALENIRITLTDASVTLINDGAYISAGNDLDIVTPGALSNNNGSITATRGNLALAAAGPIANTGLYARIAGGNTLALTTSGQLDNTGGAIFSEGNFTINTGTAALINQSGYIGTTGTGRIANVVLHTGEFDNTQGVITSTGLLALNAATLTNNGSYAQIYAADNASITLAGDLENIHGAISAGGRLALDLNGLLDNTAGQILSNGGLAIVTHNGTIDNTLGYIGGNASASLEAGTLNNTAEGVVTFGGITDITLTGTLINTDDAQILSGGKITLAAAAADNRHGIFKSGAGIDAVVSGNWNNGDFGILIAGGQGINVTASGFDNDTGIIRSTGNITFAVTGNFNNSAGEIIADRAATLTAASIGNALGLVSANGALVISATAGNLDNRLGGLSAGSSATVTVRDDLLNAGGLVMGGGILITSRNLDNTTGHIGSTGTATITLGGTLDNLDEGAIAADSDLRITAASIANTNSGTTGGIFSNGDIALATTNGALDNTGGKITALGNAALSLQADLINTGGALSTGGSLALTASTLDNTADGYLATEDDLSITLTGTLNNNAGTIIALGGANIAAGHITNAQDGLMQSGKTLALNSVNGVDNNEGTLRAFENLTISTGNASLNNVEGVIQAAGDLSISNSTGTVLDNTDGFITASGTLTIANQNAALDNTSGIIAAGAGGSANITTNTLSNTGGSIIAGRNLALDIANGGFTLDGTQEIWANNNLTLNLRNGSFVNAESSLLAYGLATINASGNITNNAGATLNAGGLSLITAGKITNLGRIDADAISTNSDYLDNRSVIIGQIVSLDAREIHNTGAGALIASTQYLGLFTSDLLSNTRDNGVTGTTTTGANIFTLGNLTIAGRGGLDEDGNPVSRAGRVLNASSTIEAFGDATVYADTFENKKDSFATETYLDSTEYFDQNNLDTTHSFTIRKPSNGSLHDGISVWYGKRNEGSTWLQYTKYIYKTRVTQDSPEARLLIGSNLTFSVNDATNYLGTIAVGNALVYKDSGAINNLGESNTVRIVHGTAGRVDIHEMDKRPQTFGRAKYDNKTIGTWIIEDELTDIPDARFGARITADTITGSVRELYNGEAAGKPVRTKYGDTDTSFDGTAVNANTGAGTISGHDATDTSGDTTVAGNEQGIGGVDSDQDTTLAPVTPPAGDGSEGRIPGGKTLPTLTITAPGEVDFTVPQNPIYSVVTDPSTPYLIVTDPRFTDWNNYISSDYFFERMGVDPQMMHKRLGDGFYESRLILDQVTALTGRRFLGDYRAEDEQFMGLMDNATDIAAAYDLRPGIALSADQIANLEKDIVWLVETMVDGQAVLAPVVYLSAATRATIESGAVIAANDIDLTITGDLTNRGTVRADRDMRLQAADMLNDGGSLKSGGNMTLVAKTDITSYAGGINAGGSATLVAGRDIRLASVAETTDYGLAGTRTQVSDQTLAAGGNLAMQAGRDLALTGVAASAGGDTTLIAGRDLTLDTVRSVNSFSTGGGGTYAKGGQITHTLTTLETGGNLILRAGDAGAEGVPASLGNINIASAQISAGGDTGILATGNINITAEIDRDFLDSKVTSKKRMDRAMHDDETVLGATLQSGGNIALQAGDIGSGGTGGSPVGLGVSDVPPESSGNITLTSAYLRAAGSITAAATGDITLAAEGEHHESITESMRKKSGVLSSKTTTTYDRVDYTGAVGATLSGDSVTVRAGRDLTVIGSAVAADRDIALSAARDLTVAAAEETYSEEHYREVKKSGLLSLSPTSLSVGKQRHSIDETAGQTIARSSVIGSAGGRVDLAAGGDARIIGSELVSQAGLSIDAAGISIAAAAQNSTATRTEKFKQSGVSLAIRGGPFEALYAAQGKTMQGAEEVADARLSNLDRLRSASGWLINSDGLEAFGASPLTSVVAVSVGSKSSEATATQTTVTQRGSVLQTGGDLTLIARGDTGSAGILPADGAAAPVSTSNLSFNSAAGGSGDIAIEGSYLSAGGALGMVAARDITLRETLDTQTDSAAARVKNASQFRSEKNASDTAAEQTAANGSLVTADTIALSAGRDLGIRGSTVAADHDIYLEAARDVRIEAAAETRSATYEQSTKTSGMFDSGRLSVTFGQQKTGFAQDENGTYAVGSLIGSTEGRIDIRSGGETRVVGSELFSQTGLSIDADRISILAAEQTSAGGIRQSFSQGGLTVRLQGGIVDAGLALVDTIERAEQAGDARLQGLYAARAARQGYGLYRGAQAVAGAASDGGAGAAGSAAGIELAVAVGAKSSRSESEWESTSHLGSRLDTAGDLTLVARGDGSGGTGVPPVDGAAAPSSTSDLNLNPATGGSGDIHIAGSDLSGQNVTLAAKNDILVESALDTHRQDGSNKNSGWEGGVALSVGQGGVGIKIFADAETGKGFEKGSGAENLNSHLAAAGTLTLVSGRDTTLAGAVVRGDTILADIGGGLTLESRQDSDYYKARQEQAGGGASFTIGSMSGEAHASYNRDKTDSDYASVREQTGLFAGGGGFDINVGGHTQLTGAVIASGADAAKNRLSTETIGFTDIANHADYETESIGASVGSGGSFDKEGNFNYGGSGITPAIGMPQNEKADGTTRSAISDGTIIVRDDFDASGNRMYDSLAGLSRDTAHANDGALENKFDLQKIQERQELARVFGEEAYANAGTIVSALYERKLDQIQKDLDDGFITKEQAGEQKNTAYLLYGEGQAANLLLNTAIGGIAAKLGGGNVVAGAAGAAAATSADSGSFDIYGDLNSPTAGSTLGSLLISAAAGALTGNAIAGASTGNDATILNQYAHREIYHALHQLDQQLPGVFSANIPKDENGNDLISPELARNLGAASVAAYYSGSAAPPGMKVLSAYSEKDDGTDAVVFQMESTGEIVISYRGSASARDWLVTDTGNAVGFESKKYVDAMKLANTIQKQFPESKIILTGHSLGGGEAGLASVRWGLSAITFNAAGVNPENYKINTNLDSGKINNFYIPLEPLTSFQALTPLADALGQQVSLKITTLPGLSNFLNHGSVSILRSLGAPDLIKVIPPIKTSGTTGAKGP